MLFVILFRVPETIHISYNRTHWKNWRKYKMHCCMWRLYSYSYFDTDTDLFLSLLEHNTTWSFIWISQHFLIDFLSHSPQSFYCTFTTLLEFLAFLLTNTLTLAFKHGQSFPLRNWTKLSMYFSFYFFIFFWHRLLRVIYNNFFHFYASQWVLNPLRWIFFFLYYSSETTWNWPLDCQTDFSFFIFHLLWFLCDSCLLGHLLLLA